jgi:1,4-dihydroxy-6-naphthoate synthase
MDPGASEQRPELRAPMPESRPVITIAHSPDPDDAFMWRALGDVDTGLEPAIDTGRFRFRAEPADIETLNARAVERGDLDLSAVSYHVYPHIAGRYAITSCGSSMGEGYGPKLVAREPMPASRITERGLLVARPGRLTTASLTLRLMLGVEPKTLDLPFDEVIEAVAEGRADAGLVIHEGQLTYPEAGLALVEDLGDWWKRETGLPLPLGANVIRRDLEDRHGPGTLREITGVLKRSIEHGLDRLDEGVAAAHEFGRGVTLEQTKKFVAMYVNPRTLDLGEAGERAIRELLSRAAAAGALPDAGEIDIVRPSDPAS